MTPAIELNGVAYQWPKRPVVVVCIDGGDPAYFERGLSDGILPNIRRFRQNGFSAVAHGVMPSYTNPNNMSIVTGSPQSVHGISGNYFLDPETGREHMMNDPVFLRSETLLEKILRRGGEGRRDHGERQASPSPGSRAGLRKRLRQLLLREVGHLHHGRERHRERARSDRPAPARRVLGRSPRSSCLKRASRYSNGAAVDLMYLSLTDYIQHKYEPGTPEINRSLHPPRQRVRSTGRRRRGRRDHGRPRHERQVPARRLAERRLSQGRAGRAVRRWSDQGRTPQ